MTKQVQRRRGSSTQHTGFTGADGEISVNTTNKSVHVHDGATAGGFEAARADLNNVDSTANLSINNLTVSGTVDGRDVAADGTKLDGIEALADVTDATNVAAAGALMTTGGSVTGDVSFGDNDKLTFGAGSDLEITHNGTENVIDSNAGTLVLRSAGAGTIELRDQGSQVLAQFNDNSDVKLFYNNNQKFATTSFGAQITGSLAVDTITNASSSTDVTIDTNFDIILDAGGSVGIGTSAPNASSKLHVSGGRSYFASNSNAFATYLRYNDSTAGVFVGSPAANEFQVSLSSGAALLKIDSSGNVGIGTTSAGAKLDVKGATAFTSDADAYTGGVGIASKIVTAGGTNDIGIQSQDIIQFATGGTTERMRIDSSGNLLVGHTVEGTWTNNNSAILRASGVATFTSTSTPPLYANRLTSDGDIVSFRKDGTLVGSIGIGAGALGIGQGTGNLGFFDAFAVPMGNTSGGASDGVITLGASGRRFNDIYATNGTIQTSDANEKQQIAALTDAEMTAAKAISALFKTFKWNSAVEAKGDAARTHAGVIAQDVQAAMTAAGLDAGDYAFFISSTWWETQTEVPAVEAVDAIDAVYEDVVIAAVEEELDEDGNVIVEAQAERTEERLVSEAVEAVEAVAAYTRTDTYDTAEEAPEGATERTRMGIRYPELLSFIGAATEQRLSNIEIRLAALEA